MNIKVGGGISTEFTNIFIEFHHSNHSIKMFLFNFYCAGNLSSFYIELNSQYQSWKIPSNLH